MTDYPDYLTPEHHALTIYNQRVPLARNTSALGGQPNQTLGGGLSVALLPQTAVDQPSFEFILKLALPALQGTVPFAQVQMTWHNNASVIQSWIELMYAASGNGSTGVIFTGGLGPCRGDQVDVQLTNLDPAQTLTYAWGLAATSHLFDRLYWQQLLAPATAPNGFTYPGNEPGSGVLASVNTLIAASTTLSRLLPTYRGRARIQIDNSAGANSLVVTITDPAGVISPSPVYYTNTIAAGAAPVREEIWLPARPVVLNLKNNATTGTITPQVTIVSSEY